MHLFFFNVIDPLGKMPTSHYNLRTDKGKESSIHPTFPVANNVNQIVNVGKFFSIELHVIIAERKIDDHHFANPDELMDLGNDHL